MGQKHLAFPVSGRPEKLSAEQIAEWRRVIEIVNAPSGPESQKPTWADRVYSRTQLLNRASELLAHIDALQAENERLRAIRDAAVAWSQSDANDPTLQRERRIALWDALRAYDRAEATESSR